MVSSRTDCWKAFLTLSSVISLCDFSSIQLATIMDLLEGSLYGMDLLKLQSVTTKLLARVDNMEKVNKLLVELLILL